jgi:Chemotaxis signal transduction protein
VQTSSDKLIKNRFCYCVGIHTILLEAEIRAELLTGQAIYPVPFAPAWCAGLISLRGDLHPIINMHHVVQGQSFHNLPQLLLIKHPNFSPIALTCDGYPRQLNLSPTDLIPYTDDNLPSWIPHSLHHQGKPLLVADHGKLLRYIQRTQGS